MKLIDSKVEVIEQLPGLDGVYKQIELAGRTCYKSEDKITEDSAKEFVDRMIKSKHGAMLEHGTVYLITTDPAIGKWYKDNKFSISKRLGSFDENHKVVMKYYITTNLRVIVENNWFQHLNYLSEPTEFHKKRITARFTCDRGVSHK